MELGQMILSAAGVFSALLVWIPLYNFIRSNKHETQEAAISEGERRTIIADIRKDLDHAWEKIRAVEDRMTRTHEAMTEMRADLKHLIIAVDRIQAKLDADS